MGHPGAAAAGSGAGGGVGAGGCVRTRTGRLNAQLPNPWRYDYIRTSTSSKIDDGSYEWSDDHGADWQYVPVARSIMGHMND